MFERIIYQSPLMISITNLKTGKIEYVNPIYSETFGDKRGDPKNDKLFIDSPDNKLSSILQEMEAHVIDGKTWAGTYQSQKKDGEVFWQKLYLYPLFENGIVTHALGIGEDITNEIGFSEELKVNKENYEHMAQNAPSGILIGNREGNHLYANKKASEITGYSISELLKISIKDLSHPDDYNEIKGRLKARLSGLNPENRYETRVLTKSGETKTIEISGSKTKWMGEMVDLVVINDITEKKRFADLLKIQGNIDYLSSISGGLDKSFEKIFDSLFEFNWIDGGGIYLMNRNDDGLKLVFHKGLSAKFKEEIQFVPQGSDKFKIIQGKEVQYAEIIEPLPDSKYMIEDGFNAILIIPLIHDDKIVGALNIASKGKTELSENEKMIFESIGNRIAQMVALVITQDKLIIKNKELEKTLNDIKEKQLLLIQKSKLESLGEMAAGVAHEVNQPLGIILLSLENVLYKISAKKASQEYLENKIDSIFSNINKIKIIIDHIRTFSHDQKSIIIERINLNEVIKSACSLINEQYTYHNISIGLNLEEDVGYALGNNQKMEQVIYNLLSNAKYALEEKEALPAAVPFDKEIKISTFSDNAKICIEVKDNGIGIEKDKIDHIFNPFFTTKPEGVGTGLGLSIVYGILTEMKGDISIESKRGEYTLARIELNRY